MSDVETIAAYKAQLRSHKIATLAQEMLSRNPDLATQLALAAVESAPTTQAESVLREAAWTLRTSHIISPLTIQVSTCAMVQS